MTELRNLKSIPTLALALFFGVLVTANAVGQEAKPQAPPAAPDAARQRVLERDAAINLSLAKKSIQEDAFYNAKVALNVWKISAIEAGNLDRKLYEDLRKILYEKSIRDNVRCIDVAVARRDSINANLCLKIYRLHAQEINAFDPTRFEDLRSRVNGIRKKER